MRRRRPREKNAAAVDAGPAGESSGEGPGERLRADLLRYLEIRERTRQELARHLEKRGYDPAAVADEVRAAAAAGWVDDRRFAEVYLRDRRRFHPMSATLVLRELARRGVPAEVAQAALAGIDPPWDERQVARAAVARRYERWPQDERRRRAAGFLRRRGFAGGVVWSVLDDLDREGRESPDGHAG